jgi:hypothetical protein
MPYACVLQAICWIENTQRLLYLGLIFQDTWSIWLEVKEEVDSTNCLFPFSQLSLVIAVFIEKEQKALKF